ncbi:MAG: zinc-binding dehydrogenase [Gaiellaceae bacterium]
MKTLAAVLERAGAARPYADSRPLGVQELDLAPPGPGELLVRIEAAGVCHSDLSTVDGTRPRPVPMVIGHEAAGVVEHAEGVADVREGDHVVLAFVPSCGNCAECSSGRPALCPAAAAANGAGRLLGGARPFRRGAQEIHRHLGVSAFAERTVVSRASAVVVPAEVPLETAALFGCAVLTGVCAVLNAARVRAGEPVAVFGLGGVGLSTVMGARVAGATPVFAVDPVASKRELALELGADVALAPEEAVEAIREATGGGARHTYEAAGHATVLEAAYRATGRGGTTVSLGLAHPDQELRLQALSLVAEARTVIGAYMGSAAPQRDIPRLISLWRAGLLPVERLVTGTLLLGEINAALDALAGGSAVRQIVIPAEPRQRRA